MGIFSGFQKIFEGISEVGESIVDAPDAWKRKQDAAQRDRFSKQYELILKPASGYRTMKATFRYHGGSDTITIISVTYSDTQNDIWTNIDEASTREVKTRVLAYMDRLMDGVARPANVRFDYWPSEDPHQSGNKAQTGGEIQWRGAEGVRIFV
jgi:hypothetical protein